jgi:transposase InsO family protein
MREHGLQAPQRVGHPHGPKAHDGTIITERPDEIWGTDLTTTVTTGEGQGCVFVAADHCTAGCVGIHASLPGNRFEALEPIRQGGREQFGGIEKGIAARLAIRHDHGSASMNDDFQRELTFLGMTSSPSFVREPEGYGVAERLIRTLKENLLWVRHFATVAELVEALREFERRYNEQWLIQRHGSRSPGQVRRELAGGVPKVA